MKLSLLFAVVISIVSGNPASAQFSPVNAWDQAALASASPKDVVVGHIKEIDDQSNIIWTYAGNFRFDSRTEFYDYRPGTIADLRVGESVCANGQILAGDGLFHPMVFIVVPKGMPAPPRSDLSGTITSLVPYVTIKTAGDKSVSVFNAFNNLAVVNELSHGDIHLGQSGVTPFIEAQLSAPDAVSTVFFDAYGQAKDVVAAASPLYYVTRFDATSGILWTTSGNFQIVAKTQLYGYRATNGADLEVGCQVVVKGTMAQDVMNAQFIAVVPPGSPLPLRYDLRGKVTALVPNVVVSPIDPSGKPVVLGAASATVARVSKASVEDLKSMFGEAVEAKSTTVPAQFLFIDSTLPTATENADDGQPAGQPSSGSRSF